MTPDCPKKVLINLVTDFLFCYQLAVTAKKCVGLLNFLEETFMRGANSIIHNVINSCFFLTPTSNSKSTAVSHPNSITATCGSRELVGGVKEDRQVGGGGGGGGGGGLGEAETKIVLGMTAITDVKVAKQL